MKNKLAMVFAVGLLLSTCACGKTAIDPSKVDFGFVTTSDPVYESQIYWFSSDLKTVQKQDLSYANLGTHFAAPDQDGNRLYLIPQGLGTRKDTKKVVSFEKGTLALDEYASDHINHIDTASIGDYVYTISNLNWTNYLERIHRVTGERVSIEVESAYLTSLHAAFDRLFCFSEKSNSRVPYKTEIRIYKPDLTLEKVIDTSDIGCFSDICEVDGDYLYVGVDSDPYENEKGEIVRIHRNDYELESFPLMQTKPHSILKWRDRFLITHHDPVNGKSHGITFWTPEGKEEHYDFDTDLMLSQVMGDELITANEEGVHIYSLPDLRLSREYPMKLERYYYPSAILYWK